MVRGDLQNKELVQDTWSPTASMRTLKYFLADTTNYKAGVHQLYFQVYSLKDVAHGVYVTAGRISITSE